MSTRAASEQPTPPERPPLHGVFVIGEPPSTYRGDLIASLESAVERAEETTPHTRRGPALIHKQDGRNYFRLTQLPPEAELHCATVDCAHKAKLLLDSRDAEVLAYCRGCAHVEFAMWMVGV
jgi:hypothetical protein